MIVMVVMIVIIERMDATSLGSGTAVSWTMAGMKAGLYVQIIVCLLASGWSNAEAGAVGGAETRDRVPCVRYEVNFRKHLSEL